MLVCMCVCNTDHPVYIILYVYRYLRTRVIRVPAGCARGGGGDGNGVARRRVNEMFSRGWLRHGVVIYKNVITLSERIRRCSVSPGTTRHAVNGCLLYNNVPIYNIIYMRDSHHTSFLLCTTTQWRRLRSSNWLVPETSVLLVLSGARCSSDLYSIYKYYKL